MRIPYSWLAQHLIEANPGLSLTPETLEQALLDLGHEIETIYRIPTSTGPVCLGYVSEIEPLEGFKKPIRYCSVEVGTDHPQKIICGATNFSVGDLVIVALPGAVLPGDFSITARKIYGHRSEGMICSAAELGLPIDQGGILVLPPQCGQPGDEAAALIGMGEWIYDLTITPDRGYCLSIRGLTRDLAAILNLDYLDPAMIPLEDHPDSSWPVHIDPQTQCRRFSLAGLNDIDPQATSPWWLQRRLLLCGIHCIHPVVDVTNYVMLELGHPLHAHDRDHLHGMIHVRFAHHEESLPALDQQTYSLVGTDVVVADDHGPAALAGVIGAQSTHIRSTTTDVLLEAAVWDPPAVSRTSRRLHLGTESARRYERGIDPGLSRVALQRALHLLQEITGGIACPGLADWVCPEFSQYLHPDPIVMALEYPTQLTGTSYCSATLIHRLTQMGCTLESNEDSLTIHPPTWRPDLRQPADIVEDIVRLEGMHTIGSLPATPPPGTGLTPTQQRRRALAKALAMRGFVEILPTPFLDPTIFDQWGLDPHDSRRQTLTLANPLDPTHPCLATTLLPALLEALTRNLSRGMTDLALFGIAPVILPGSHHDYSQSDHHDILQRTTQLLPAQPHHLVALISGHTRLAGPYGPAQLAHTSDIIDTARLIGEICACPISLRPIDYRPWHPGRGALVSIEDLPIGYAGQLHPGILETMGLPPNTYALEIALEAIPFTTPRPSPIISVFPPVHQDLAIVVDEHVLAQDLLCGFYEGGGELLEEVRLFDVYTGPQIDAGKKSLTFALQFRAPDRTLTEAEATQSRDQALAYLSDHFGAVLRTL